MSERCERCRKGFGSAEPKDDVEWLLGATRIPAEGERQLRIARCTRCSSYLVDVVSHDRHRENTAIHDVCVVQHESARSSLLDRAPLALAALSPQLRRRHIEELVAEMPTKDREALGWIEQGSVACTELFRATVTRIAAHTTPGLPTLSDVRPRHGFQSTPKLGTPIAGTLHLSEGVRVVTQHEGGELQLVSMQGDRVLWRTPLPKGVRETQLALVYGTAHPLVLAISRTSTSESLLFLVDHLGKVRGEKTLDFHGQSVEAISLGSGAILLRNFPSQTLLRDDATVLWQGTAPTRTTHAVVGDSLFVVDASCRMLAIDLRDGHERWSIPTDRNATVAASGDGHILLASSDVVTRFDVRGPRPQLRWIAQGAATLALRNGGIALVRDRWEKSGRRIECIVIDPEGRRRFAIARPDATKSPSAELGANVLLFHNGGDVAVSVHERVSYAVSVAQGQTIGVTLEDGGAWIEYDGIVDRIDAGGKRVGRYRIGA
ncbi:MAG: hypothetical protein Q8Q09_17265 [Deltaproteobacteria bacterium]|nr:hypothetical protein [Deltaproteobacteria bacterium]